MQNATHINASLGQTGRVYIYNRGGGPSGEWTLTAQLAPRDLAACDRFGHAVVLRGGYLIVGAPAAKLNGSTFI
jgi:hypothetical protein